MIKMLVRWFFAVAPIVVFISLNLASQGFYTHRSLGANTDTSASFTEVPEISALDLDDTFPALRKTIDAAPHTVVSDTSNLVLAKVFGMYFDRDTVSFPSYDFWSLGNYVPDPSLPWLRDPAIEKIAKVLSIDRHSHLHYDQFEFDTLPPNVQHLRTEFTADKFAADVPLPKEFLLTGPRQSILNRFQDHDPQTFRLETPDRVKNRLIFVNSSLGLSYAFGKEPEAFFQLEPDYFYSGRSMAGIGRYILFRVENPTPQFRLVMWMSTSLKGGATILPPVSVIGTKRVSTSILGLGSARVVSEPVTPRMIDGSAYVLLDMGLDATLFKPRDYGFWFALYHHEINLDHRHLTAFARDISVIDESRYASLGAPEMMEPDRGDLLLDNLFYSGIYEDGWMSTGASMRLHSSADDNDLHLQGSIPLVNDELFQTNLKIQLDGQPLATRSLGLGAFDIHVPINPGDALRTVTITVDKTQILGHGDSRPVGANIFRVAFETTHDITAANSPVTIGSGWYPIEHYAGEMFRWFSNDAQIVVTSDAARKSVLKLDLAGGPGLTPNKGVLHVLDDQGATILSTPLSGRAALDVPVTLHAGRNDVTLHVDGGGHAVASDPRFLNVRVFSVKVASN